MKIELRVHNASSVDFTDVSVSGQPFGDIAAGDTTEYRSVATRLRYAAVGLTADGRRVTGQTLNFGSRRFTHRIDIIDLAAGHLDIDVIRE